MISEIPLLKECPRWPGQHTLVMNTGLADPLSITLPQYLSRRKRPLNDSVETEPSGISDIDNEGGFTLVVSLKMKRRMRTVSQTN